ncbi:MAG: tyrosine-type recombinase/integrase [Pararhodobacter sp.]
MADKMKLTQTSVAKVEAVEGKTLLIWDTDLRGFGLRIAPGGAKAYIMQRRIGKETRRITICRAADKKAEEARKEAERLAGLFAQGIDPQAADRRQKALRMTLADAFKAYIAAPKKKGAGTGSAKRPRTIRDIEKVSKRFSDWMDKPVTKITGDMVKERHAKIAATSPEQANLAMRYLRAALNHVNADTDDEPIIARNPVDRLNRANLWAPEKRASGRIPSDRIGDWIGTVQSGLIGLRYENQYRAALLFMLFTGCRLAEAMGDRKSGYEPLKWSAVDLDARKVTFYATKNGNDHVLPLGPWLSDMLTDWKALAGNKYVFSNASGDVPEDMRGAYARIKKATGLHITAHDLRRTFLSVAAANAGLSEYVIKAVSNHSASGDVTAGYIHLSENDLRDAMERIESALLQLCNHLEPVK